MSYRKVISKEGEVFYFNYENRHTHFYFYLYRKETYKRFFGLSEAERYVKLEKMQLDWPTVSNPEHWDVDEFKKRINQLIDYHKHSLKRRERVNNWNGYVGDDDQMEKKLMRNEKLNDLISGDLSKLEEFLNV